jgi:ankyrin repeat protein
LRFLLRKDTFGDKINDHDWTGQAPIHYAARYGYLEAVELLLDHGADVNLGCAKLSKPLNELGPDSFDENLILGQTAIDVALNARGSRTRDIILAGGAPEVQAWQIRIKQVIDLLVQRGGHVGYVGSAGNYMELETLTDPRRWKRFYQSYIGK